MEVFIVLGRVIFSSLSNVFQKKLTHEGLHPFLIVMLSYLVLSLISLPLLPLINVSELTSFFWFNSFFAALLDMAGTLCLVMSLSKTDLSVFGPLNAYKVVISMLLAMVFLGEIPSLQGFTGVAIIMIGSYFLLPPSNTTKRYSFRQLLAERGVQYRFLSILLFSIGTLPLKNAVISAGPLATTVFWCLIGFPLAALAYRLFITDQFTTALTRSTRYIWPITYLGLLIFLMQYMTMLVLSELFIAYSLALFQLSMVLHVFLGYRIFNEQHIARRLFACLIMITGSILVINA